MKGRSDLLDFLRWIAALAVVSGHLRSILFEDFNHNISNILFKAIYFVTGFGHQAVIIFFVLSGYLICKSILDKYKIRAFDMVSYFKARFTRIYIVLIPALLLTYFLDKTGYIFDKRGIYTTCEYITSFQQNPVSRLTFFHFLSSLFMLQNIWLPTFGSNGPLWSLAPEFWCYIIFPFLAGLVFTTRKNLRFVTYPICILLFFFLIPSWIAYYLLIWLCGLLPYLIKKQGIILRFIAILFSSAILIYSRMNELNFLGELVFAIAIALIISSFDDKENISIKSGFNKKIASFSYSLYLIHYPLALFILTLMDRFLISTIKVKMNSHSLFTYAIVLILVYVASFGFARLTEYQTERLRKII